MDDLISKQKAIDVLEMTIADDWEFDYARDRMNELPSAEPERKTGKWLEKSVIHKDEADTVIEEWQSAKCSVCGKYHTTLYLYYFSDYNYCPHCGADMRGEQE